MRSPSEQVGANRREGRPEDNSPDDMPPQSGETTRARDLRAIWRVFRLERHDAVRRAFDSRRPAPEIAYRLGELVHAYFRPRGVTLTGLELRRLVYELVAPSPPPVAKSSDDRAAPAVRIRTEMDVERLLARTIELAKLRRPMSVGRTGRDEALRSIDAVVDEVLRAEEQPALAAELRERIVRVALNEIYGLGLLDRLWADRSVRAIFVNGPGSVFVERENGLARASEAFSDPAHLLELVSRLALKPASGVAAFRLRDGGGGIVIFPPAAPNGPVLAILRGDPSRATLEQLIGRGLLDSRGAALLFVAVRARLNIAVLGPAGAGKTAILAAIAHDLAPSTRLVTLARHRTFNWSAAGKIELISSQEAPYSTLLDAAVRLQPQIWLLDSVRPAEARAVLALIGRGAKGLVMAGDPAVLLPELGRAVDLVVRLHRRQHGGFQVVSLEDARGAAVLVYENGRIECRTREPAFMGKVLDAGLGEALATLLR